MAASQEQDDWERGEVDGWRLASWEKGEAASQSPPLWENEQGSRLAVGGLGYQC